MNRISAAALMLIATGCSDVRLWRPGELERVHVDIQRPDIEEPTQQWSWAPSSGPEIRYKIGDVFCTKESWDITIPFKLLVVVDYSGSMNTSDPNQLRIDAIEQLVQRYANDPFVYFGFLRFGSHPAPLPNLGKDFTNEPSVLSAAIQELRSVNTIPEGATNYQDALAWSWDAIDTDMRQESHIAGTRYGILFITDGRPNVPETGTPDQALAANRPKVRDRITGCDGFQAQKPLNKMIEWMNTYFINVGSPDPLAADLLRDMAEGTSTDPCGPNNWGHGTYTEVNDPGALNFDLDLPTMRKVFINRGGMFFLNYNVRAAWKDGGMQMVSDSDGDGLPDFIESAPPDPSDEWASSRHNWDTDGDGISDLVEWTLGLKTNERNPSRVYPRPAVSSELVQFGIPVAEGQVAVSDEDRDGDGLTNDEEAFIGTDANRFDTDRDGLSDFVELRFGLNPDDENDVALDGDGDGFDNKTEVETGMDPHHAESPEFREKYAHRIMMGNEFIDTFQDGGQDKIRTCYEFQIDNVLFIAPQLEDRRGEFNVFELAFIDQTRLASDDQEFAARRELLFAKPVMQVPNYYFQRTFPDHW